MVDVSADKPTLHPGGTQRPAGIGTPVSHDLPVAGSRRPTQPVERDLRLDLFRGIALWLIFLDHIPSNIVSWITIRNYGFSDATEIFVFISGYTAAFVYGRAMRERGVVVASARILKRAWQVYVAHIFLFVIYLAEIAYVSRNFENPLYAEEMGIFDFLRQPDVTLYEALLLKFKPANMDVLPLYIALLAAFPLYLWALLRQPTLALAGSLVVYVSALRFDINLPAYPEGTWTFNPFAWQLLFGFGAWCAVGGAQRLAGFMRSPVVLGLAAAYLLFAFADRDDVVFPTLRLSCPEMDLGLDVPDRQNQPRRSAICAFPGARRADRAIRPAPLAGPEKPLVAAGDRLRPAFTGDLLPRRVSGVCSPFHHGAGFRSGLGSGPGQRGWDRPHGCGRLAFDVV